jgi:VWFA-related protein
MPGENAPVPGTNEPAPVTPSPGSQAAGDAQQPTQPRPSTHVNTIPPGSAPRDDDSREQLYKFTTQVNAVTVPVTVKDGSGHLVAGLLAKDFSVYEDGVKQRLTYFTSDPFPLSAAIVIDMGMPDNVLSKVRNTLSALIGAFGQFDEVAVYSYGNTVKKWQDFTAAAKVPPNLTKQLKSQRGSAAGTPVVGGPMGQTGPVINGRNAADNTPNIPSMPNGSTVRQSRVLNDAILAAARDLGAREGVGRRRILFVVSDGREVGSDASYADVMKVLLSNGISVYAVGVGSAGIPGYRTLEKVHIPGAGYGNILPKYASATGGQVFPSFDEQAIETAYSQATEEARNQYTLVYQTRATPSSAYRSIEVRVTRGGLRIYAKDGYYPLPPKRAVPATSSQP